MDKETWVDIEGYEGLYQISTLGRVKSLHGGGERILAPRFTPDGYQVATLCKNGGSRQFSVHRLVMNAFSPNPDPIHLTQINHRDECKSNNNLENLEWCTPAYNCHYGNFVKNIRIGRKEYEEKCRERRERAIADEMEVMKNLSIAEKMEHLKSLGRWWMVAELKSRLNIDNLSKWSVFCSKLDREAAIGKILDESTSCYLRRKLCEVFGISYESVRTKSRRAQFTT